MNERTLAAAAEISSGHYIWTSPFGLNNNGRLHFTTSFNRSRNSFIINVPFTVVNESKSKSSKSNYWDKSRRQNVSETPVRRDEHQTPYNYSMLLYKKIPLCHYYCIYLLTVDDTVKAKTCR